MAINLSYSRVTAESVFSHHKLNVEMALQQYFRTNSTDSLGSDAVFTDDSYFQGRLKSTEGRKGSVFKKHAFLFHHFVSFISVI